MNELEIQIMMLDTCFIIVLEVAMRVVLVVCARMEKKDVGFHLQDSANRLI